MTDLIEFNGKSYTKVKGFSHPTKLVQVDTWEVDGEKLYVVLEPGCPNVIVFPAMQYFLHFYQSDALEVMVDLPDGRVEHNDNDDEYVAAYYAETAEDR